MSSQLKHQNASLAPNLSTDIKNDFVQLSVRLAGCYITKCALSGRPVLYCDADTTKAKINASHMMCPVGRYDGLGGQHGFSRWVDYKVTSRGENFVELVADDNYDGLLSTRWFELDDHSLTITSTIKNVTDSDLKTSLGEHLYFDLGSLDTTDLRFDGQTLDEMFGAGAASQVSSGSAIHWRDFKGSIDINFGEQKQIRLSAETTLPDLLGLSFWRRPGTDSICIEPTIGHIDSDCEFANDLVKLASQATFKLTTKIKLSN